MVVTVAFVGAAIADPGARVEHDAEDFLVPTRVPHCQPSRRGADIRAVQAGPNALPHVHVFGEAGIRAARTQLRAVHRMACGRVARFMRVIGNVRMQRDHSVDRHQPPARLRRVSQPFFAASERLAWLCEAPPMRPPLRDDA